MILHAHVFFWQLLIIICSVGPPDSTHGGSGPGAENWHIILHNQNIPKMGNFFCNVLLKIQNITAKIVTI